MAKKEEPEAPLLKCSCGDSLAAVKNLRVALVQNGRRATVLRPGFFVGTGCDRTLFTVGNNADAGRVDALGKQIVASGSGTTLTKGKVVLAGAALVTMAFNGHGQ